MSKERLESLLRQVQQRRMEPRVRSTRVASPAPAAAAAPAPRQRSLTPLEQAVSRASGFAPSAPTSAVPRKKSEPSFDSPAAQYAKQNAKAKSVAPKAKKPSLAPTPAAAKPAVAAKSAAPRAEAIAVAPAAVPSTPIAQARGEKPVAKTFGELITRALNLRP